jgi:hypothetical protein
MCRHCFDKAHPEVVEAREAAAVQWKKRQREIRKSAKERAKKKQKKLAQTTEKRR